ncbi:MAG: IS110 family transposase [bacterium]|nr:IS110 family transposase [bacterium]
MLYLGIDQHRKQLTVNLRNEQGDIVLKRQVSTQWDRVRKFFEELCELARPEGGFVAVVEVCGFNHWLLEMLGEYGCREIVLIQPDTRSKKKTDRRDAAALSQTLWVNRERLTAGKPCHGLRRVVPPSKEDGENRELTALRKRMGAICTRTINKVQRILLKHNLQQECPTKGIQTKKARRWLADLPLEEIDRMEMDILLAQWDLWDSQLEQLNKKIQERQRLSPLAAIVASIPGAGAYSSLTLASRIGTVDRFPRPSSLANYWGLTPGCRNSGDATDRLGSITKQGSAIARFILGQMVLHVLKRDPSMKAWHGRIKRRRGSKIARVAVMRRLATILWHMAKNNEAYMFGGPPRLRLEKTA